MPKLTSHQSQSSTKLLFIGDSGCISGNCKVSVTRGDSKGKRLTLKELYNLHNKEHHNKNRNLETRVMADLGGYAGLHTVDRVIHSGKKLVRQYATNNSTIFATDEHLFSTVQGWKRGDELSIGDSVHVWVSHTASNNQQLVRRRGAGRHSSKGRVYCYSIQYHPDAMTNIVAGKDYKRERRARLVLEAELNRLTLEELVYLLRNDQDRAATLTYLDMEGKDIHHKDGDPSNDKIENLVLVDHAVHAVHHSGSRNKAHKEIQVQQIVSIGEHFEDDTYDIIMQDPHRNFICEDFVVHNSGKTGALASLVKAGYELAILDFDSGLDILVNVLREEKNAQELLSRVYFVTLTDKMKAVGGQMIPEGIPTAFTRAMNLLTNWKTESEDLGPISNWDSKRILVIDSLTFMANAAFRHVEVAFQYKDPRQTYGEAQKRIENCLGLLYSDSVKCNVIVNSHISFLEVADGTKILKGYPTSVGKALNPVIPRYFNTMLRAKVRGAGASAKRVISAVPDGLVDIKAPIITGLPPELPIETGLAEYFRLLRGGNKDVAIQTQAVKAV